MADGLGNKNPLYAIGSDPFLYAGSFQCNGTSNPVSTTFRGPPGLVYTVTYAATGAFTITLDASLNLPDLPGYIEANPQFAVLATDWFDCAVTGEFNRTTRSFVIQAHRSGTGQAPANTAGNRINWSLQFRNSTSR